MADEAAVLEATDEVKTSDAQPQSDDQNQPDKTPDPGQAPAKDEGSTLPEGVASEEAWLDNLLAIEHSPTRADFNDEELDILDKYYSGDLNPTHKSGSKSEKKSSEDTGRKEPESKDEDPESKAPDLQVDEETIKSSSSLDLSIMKELGAKTKGEVVDKIRGLRKAISGKLESDPGYSEAKGKVDFLQKAAQNDTALWSDLMKGDPRAIQYAKQNYGLTITKGDAEPVKSESGSDDSNKDNLFHIPREKFIDEDAADAVNTEVNKVLSGFKKELNDFKNFRVEYDKNMLNQQQSLASSQAKNDVVDEMVQVAADIPQLKGVENIREAIQKWREGGVDARMDYFQDLFEIANKSKVNLITAQEIDKGRKASLSVVQAKEEGRKEAYSHTPNKSLSDIQGKNINKPEEYTEAQLVEMVETGKMPDRWFDENDDPDPQKIPKNAWKLFWPEGKPF